MAWYLRRVRAMEADKRTTPTMTLLRWMVGLLSPYKLEVVLLIILSAAYIGARTLTPYVGKMIVDEGIIAGDRGKMLYFTLVYVGLTLLSWLTRMFRTYFSGRLNSELLYVMRSRAYEHLCRLDLAYISRQQAGRIISLITNDVSAVGNVVTSENIDLMINMLTIVGSVYIMSKMHVWLTLAALSVLPLLVGVTLVFARKTRQVYKTTREKVSLLTSSVEQSVYGARVSQAFTERRKIDYRRFSRISRESVKANLKAAMVTALINPSLSTIRAIATAIIIFYGGLLVTRNELTVGSLIAFYNYTGLFYQPIIMVATFYNVLQSALASAERVYLFLKEKPGIEDPPEAEDREILDGEIVLENVHFSYDGSKVFEGLNLKIRSKSITALVGHTGAGKTTIANLILRLYDPQKGRVLIDGVDIRKYTIRSLRRQVSLIPQEPVLFQGTVLDNIRIGNPEATREDIEKTIDELGLKEVIESLPDGLETKVKPGGENLSVGQRQIISFLRTMVRNPKIIVIDEAMSSVDPFTEHKLQEAILRLARRRTCIVIAHRPTTVRVADEIIVLKHGKVVERGSHSMLIARQGEYARLYSQLLWQ